jgi:hypothetical protein
MGTVTTAKGIPYSLGTDFSDPRAVRDLALYEDAALAAYDAAFTAGPRPAAFLVRSGADGNPFGNGSDFALASSVVEWNTTGGAINSGGTWTQDVTEVPSWYLFGANLFAVTASGSATTGAAMQVIFIASSLDPVTLLPATAGLGDGYPKNISGNSFSTESTETNTGGEFFTGYCILPMYRGSVIPLFGNRDSAVQTKKSITGSTFWGIKLGAV